MKSKMRLAVVILAAGEGKRMKSNLPKVLHPLGGRPLLKYVLDLAKRLKPQRLITVVNPRKEFQAFKESQIELVIQKKPLGTGNALQHTGSRLKNFQGEIVVLCGDTPFFETKTLKDLLKFHATKQSKATLLTAEVKNPLGYGRIIRGPEGEVERIIEEKEATAAEKKVNEVNTGAYIFNKQELFKVLPQLDAENRQKEFYLTDVIELLKERGQEIRAYKTFKEEEVFGINSRKELAQAERILREKINSKWLAKGITLIDPSTTFIDFEVKIGKDTIIFPFSFLEGKTRIGEGSLVGPLARLSNAKVGKKVEIQNSYLKRAIVEDGAKVGPFAYLRPGTLVKTQAKVGSFVEVKNSKIGNASKVPHLSYIGDAQIGKEVNIGAGTITCNYDGRRKYQTIIENGAFIGSDTQLVAPLKIGKKAVTGAGSSITKDVPAGALSLERTEQKIIKNWTHKRKIKTKSGK